MKKRMTTMITALVVVFGGIIGFNLFKNFMIKRFFASYEAPPVSVSSVSAIAKNWEPRISAIGNFVAISGVDVNSQAAGNVVKINFTSGQYIEKGTPLIDIDDRVEQATLKFNQADMALKAISYQRQSDLFKRGATPGSNVDEARANLEQAQAQVEKVSALLNQKHISAPFSGKLGIRQVNLGQYITPGQTAIVTLQSLDPLYLEFNLPEQLYKQLHLNQAIQFSVEQFPDVLFAGKISAINAKIDPNTHNILVQATFPNCPANEIQNNSPSAIVSKRQETAGNKTIITCNSLLNRANHIDKFVFIPGMFAAIEIEQPPIPNVIVLPSTAISYSLYGNSVFVIEKDKKGKQDKNGETLLYVKRVFVNTGSQEGNFTVIQSGIKAGELVVSSGEMKLQNKSRVIINNSVTLNEVNNADNLIQ